MSAVQPDVETRAEKIGNRSLDQQQEALLRYCFTLTGTQKDAEDLTQDTWLKAIRASSTLSHSNPEAWLRRIAKNMWIDQSRRNKVLRRILERERPEPWQPAGSALEIESVFQALLKHLSPLQRTVFLLRDVFGYSNGEAAVMLAATEGAIKAALHRARLALRFVQADLESGGLPVPKEDDMKVLLRTLASAYLRGDIQELIGLIQRSDADPAASVGLVQSTMLRSTTALRKSGKSNTTHPASLQLAA